MVVTLHDVAKKAGVSIATVSRVVNNVHTGRVDIRQRVLDAAEELGYVWRSPIPPRGLGETMRFVIHPLVPLDQFYGDILQGASEEAHEYNYDLYFSVANRSMGALGPHSNTGSITEEPVRGVIYAGDIPSEIYESIREAGTPLVLVNSYLSGQHVESVMCDNFQSAYRSIQYLIQLGHRRIVCIGYPFEAVTSVEERIYGYLLAVQEAGIEQQVIRATLPVDEMYEAMKGVLLSEPPTAVFAVSDEMAISAMQCVKERGFRVPEDMSFVGVNDLDMALRVDPPLTTVRIPRREMGRVAVRRLIELIRHPDMPRTRTDVLCTFIERASCARAPEV